MEFPHTAVICAATKEDMENLCDFFIAHKFFEADTGEPFKEYSDMDWNIYYGETCYDIEGKAVNWSDTNYYEKRFPKEYPELMPEDPKWYLCSVQDFIAMCNGVPINAEFDVADDGDLESMLRG